MDRDDGIVYVDGEQTEFGRDLMTDVGTAMGVAIEQGQMDESVFGPVFEQIRMQRRRVEPGQA